MGNRFLNKAKVNKKDEFYTQLPDIEAELRHYREHFHGKVVLCNCDDPFESNFFKYFAMNFNFLGLKKLIATCYVASPVAGEQISFGEVAGFHDHPDTEMKPHKIIITEVKDENHDGAIDLADVEYLIKNKKNTLTVLEGDGDFRSDECIELLQEADIVVTNPPFSLFREYVAQLMEYEKMFAIIGNKNAITYKEIFPLLLDGRMWIGQRNINSDIWFIVPDDYECEKVENGLRLKHIMACWFTNLDIPKRHQILTLYRQYTPEEFPKYDNYDAIEVSKVTDIPYDYDGVMGVPITFMDKYNPDQFEIVGMCENLDLYGLKTRVYTAQECRDRYFELFNKQGVYDLNAAGVIDGKKVYQRILIRRK